MTCTKIHRITAGDTLTPVGARLLQRGTDDVMAPVDLNGRTVEFVMVDESDQVIVDHKAATIVDPDAGEVRYDFASSEVSTPGSYLGYFVVSLGAETDVFPTGEAFMILILDRPGLSGLTGVSAPSHTHKGESSVR